MPSSFRLVASSAPVAAKSSKARSVTRMMWSAMNLAPLRAAVLRMLQAALPFETAQPAKS